MRPRPRLAGDGPWRAALLALGMLGGLGCSASEPAADTALPGPVAEDPVHAYRRAIEDLPLAFEIDSDDAPTQWARAQQWVTLYTQRSLDVATDYVIDTGVQLVNDLRPGYRVFRTPMAGGHTRIEIQVKGAAVEDLRRLCGQSLVHFMQTGVEPPGKVPEVFEDYGLLHLLPDPLDYLPELPSPGDLLPDAPSFIDFR